MLFDNAVDIFLKIVEFFVNSLKIDNSMPKKNLRTSSL